jgi:hypothetical protein
MKARDAQQKKVFGFQDRSSTGRNMTKTGLLATAPPGSRPLKNARHEKYCRLRAGAQQRIPAYREAGWETSNGDDAYSNACRIERRPEIKQASLFLQNLKSL